MLVANLFEQISRDYLSPPGTCMHGRWGMHGRPITLVHAGGVWGKGMHTTLAATFYPGGHLHSPCNPLSAATFYQGGYVSVGGCSDGIWTGNEEWVDCGGRCPPCKTVYGTHLLLARQVQWHTYPIHYNPCVIPLHPRPIHSARQCIEAWVCCLGGEGYGAWGSPTPGHVA